MTRFRRRLVFPLLATLLAVVVAAHEPYLRLTANADGTVTAEAGFSDNADVAGQKLVVRDRTTGATLGGHVLPAGGRLTFAPPPGPYRVVFEGGAGHRISKPGPERETAAAAVAAPVELGPVAVALVVEPPVPGMTSVPAVAQGGDLIRLVLVVGIVFLFGTVAFALGYAAGRHTR